MRLLIKLRSADAFIVKEGRKEGRMDGWMDGWINLFFYADVQAQLNLLSRKCYFIV